ncbi:hypothetical protein TNCV_3085341 [Trichonephila clavipes]|nr:hypothetical protein TNCV_3085341 [Trichonephila clavipes]
MKFIVAIGAKLSLSFMAAASVNHGGDGKTLLRPTPILKKDTLRAHLGVSYPSSLPPTSRYDLWLAEYLAFYIEL